jgi:hypothetical protein
MGTNYYLHIDACPTCRHPKEKLHIGKSSAGWCFSLHQIPEDDIMDLEDWIANFSRGEILNEYGESLTPKEMLEVITDRPEDSRRDDRVIDGDGTYDLIQGEFS